MALGILYLEWLNTNAQRNYPLSDLATRFDTTTTVQIPNDFIVDMVLLVPTAFDGDITQFHILNIATFSLGAVVTIGHNGVPVGVASIPFVNYVKNKSYPIAGSGDTFGDTTGVITIGNIEQIKTYIPGLYTFDIAGAGLEGTVIRPDIRGVSSVSISNSGIVSKPMYGDIILVAGANVRLTTQPSDNTITIDAIPTASLAEDCPCVSDTLSCVKSINTVYPDNNGKINMVGNTCIQIQEDAPNNSLSISDTCSTPCCGCSELAVVQQDINLLSTQMNTLTNLASRLQANIEAMNTSLLGSKLGTGASC